MLNLIVSFPDSRIQLMKSFNNHLASPFGLQNHPGVYDSPKTFILPPVGGTFCGFPLNDVYSFDFKVLDHDQNMKGIDLIVEIIHINNGRATIVNTNPKWQQEILLKFGFKNIFNSKNNFASKSPLI